MSGHLGRVAPETVLRRKPGRWLDVVLCGVVGVIGQVPKIERSASFHGYEITGALCSREVAHSGARRWPSAPGVTTPYDGVVRVRRRG